jgi:hypothetical protein
MELLAIVGVLAALGVAAGRFGADSRPSLESKERLQAGWGLSWIAPPPAPPGPHWLHERSAHAIAARVRRQSARGRYVAA